ncbi:ABC transporter substrate-binding protein [Sulfobacillus harzensis]|uniref:ABC transporter substrate-binding protein n=1 Tax=Sulfobacillus harzensis TaxID=2729629 RepID=UPI001A9AD401|nr:ABC transporter substrate-binding protein [Sulfobacillus harzensis]
MTKGSMSIMAASVLGLTAVISGCGSGVGGGGGSTTASGGTITVGTLYASSGQFSTSSMGEYQGLKFWAHEVNAQGGVYVKATGKKEKIKLVAYNDQSSTQTATTQYQQLITQNHVNMLVADFGSVLTSVGVPIAQENKMLLFDQSGSGTTFFDSNPPNPYIVLTSIQASSLWPDSLSNYILHNNIKRVAIIYGSNDFTGAQDTTLVSNLKAAGVTPVYNHPVPTSTTNFSALLNSVAATHPDMVVELGYDTNDIPFLQAVDASKYKFPKVFTIFPGQESALFAKDIGVSNLAGTYTYAAPPLTKVTGVNYGMSLSQFTSKFEKYAGVSSIDFENIAGYNTGLILQKTLATATSLKQTAFRQAVNTFSGKVTTIEGTFKINTKTGAQEGLPFPIGQWSDNNGQLGIHIYESTIKGEQ